MRRKNSQNLLTVFFLILSLVIALPPVTDAEEPILIGVPVPLTGPFAPIGVDSQKGVELAVEQINSAGGLLGRPVELVLFDTKDFAPERLMSAANKLVGQR